MPQKIRIARRFAVAIMLLTLGMVTPSIGGVIADCNQSLDPDLQIRGCTGFIQSGATGNNLAIAHTNRGIAYDALNETKRAIVDFSKAIEIFPDYAVAHYNRGVAYADIGEFERAIVDFDTAIRLVPDDPDAFDARGFTYVDMGDYGRAIADFSTAIELDPGFGGAYYHRGLAYGAIRDLDRGVADYNKALELGCLRQGWCPER